MNTVALGGLFQYVFDWSYYFYLIESTLCMI